MLWSIQRCDSIASWKPFDLGKLKINYDIAVVDGKLFMAAICCDSEGNILKAITSTTNGRNNNKGEARAARMECQVAEEFMENEIIFEGDCLNLVNQVMDEIGEPDWDIVGEVRTIRRLLKDHVMWSFTWIPHEANFAAHNLANYCINCNLFGELIFLIY